MFCLEGVYCHGLSSQCDQHAASHEGSEQPAPDDFTSAPALNLGQIWVTPRQSPEVGTLFQPHDTVIFHVVHAPSPLPRHRSLCPPTAGNSPILVPDSATPLTGTQGGPLGPPQSPCQPYRPQDQENDGNGNNDPLGLPTPHPSPPHSSVSTTSRTPHSLTGVQSVRTRPVHCIHSRSCRNVILSSSDNMHGGPPQLRDSNPRPPMDASRVDAARAPALLTSPAPPPVPPDSPATAGRSHF